MHTRHDTHTGIYIEITTNIHLQTCASWRHVNQPETLPTYWTTTWYSNSRVTVHGEDRMRGNIMLLRQQTLTMQSHWTARSQSHHPWGAAAKLKYVHVKVYWYGIRFDICLGAQCYRIIWSPQNTQHKKAMRLHTHTHIHQERKLAEEAWLGNSTADRTCTQAQPKEGHKIWLTQEADAKSWSSLKHVQPKEAGKFYGWSDKAFCVSF